MLRSYRNCADAGEQLSTRLMHLKGQAPVILALPRGGMPVAFKFVQALQAPLYLVMVRTIGASSAGRSWQQLRSLTVTSPDRGEP